MGRFGCVFAAAVASVLGMVLLGGTPIFAASLVLTSDSTDAFSANIRLQARFLVQASRMARDSATSETIKQFAASQGSEQSGVLDELDRRMASDARLLFADTHDEVTTGRSIAAGPLDVGTYAPPGGVGVLLPAAAVGLDHLAGTKGEDFDELYTALVRNVLTNLAGFYGAYAKTGDDPALRAIAVHELPRIEADKVALE